MISVCDVALLILALRRNRCIVLLSSCSPVSVCIDDSCHTFRLFSLFLFFFHSGQIGLTLFGFKLSCSLAHKCFTTLPFLFKDTLSVNSDPFSRLLHSSSECQQKHGSFQFFPILIVLVRISCQDPSEFHVLACRLPTDDGRSSLLFLLIRLHEDIKWSDLN